MLQETIDNSIMPLLQSLLVAFITIAVGYAISFLKSKKKQLLDKVALIKDEDARNAAYYAIERIDDVLSTNIIAMNDTATKIKNSTLTGNDRQEQLQKLAEDVKAAVLVQLSESIKQQSAVVINDLDSYIANRLEKNLKELKDNGVLNKNSSTEQFKSISIAVEPTKDSQNNIELPSNTITSDSDTDVKQLEEKVKE